MVEGRGRMEIIKGERKRQSEEQDKSTEVMEIERGARREGNRDLDTHIHTESEREKEGQRPKSRRNRERTQKQNRDPEKGATAYVLGV